MTKAAELAKMGEVLTNSQIGGRRNIAYNGAMQVAQRNTSVTGLGGSDGYFTVDRYKVVTGGSAGRFTQSQVAVSDLSGFTKALKLECTTADTTVGSGEYLLLEQSFEGQDLQQLKKGTSDAEQLTISFYVKANANATYVVELYDADNARHVSQSYNVTTSWNRIILTFPGDTTGAFDNDNAQSLRVFFWLHSGTSYNSGTLSTTWHTTNANRAVGVTSFFDSTDRTFFLTGLQIEVGEQATPFEHRSFGEELELCKRYYEQWNTINGENIWLGTSYSGNNPHCFLQFNTLKRAAPTITLPSAGNSGNAISFLATDGGYASTIGSHNADKISTRGNRIAGSSYSGITAGSPTTLFATGTPVFKFDSEL
jgi:hypothetical protein